MFKVILWLLLCALGVRAFILAPIHSQRPMSLAVPVARGSALSLEDPAVVSAVEKKEEEGDEDEECEIDFETMQPVDPDKCM